MALAEVTESDLKREVDDLRDRYPKLTPDHLFVLWFLRAYLTDDEQLAVSCLSGGAGDKGVDAVLLDEQAKTVAIVQGKYRRVAGKKAEKRADVMTFADLARELTGEKSEFADFLSGASPDVQLRLAKSRRRILQDGYRLRLFYATLGRCSSAVVKEAQRITRSAGCDAELQVLDGRQVMLLLSDYLDGVAPPVPSLDLEMESGDGVELKGVFQRYDAATDIESWVSSMTSRGVARLFAEAGNRLFARNVRGFLGSTAINTGMETTLSRSPEYFWYFNNGITIICDHAEEVRSHGRSILRVSNPQVINGQQTTRILSRMASKAPKASVSVRVIRVPRDGRGGPRQYEALVSQIVAATNWQNAISASDLMANDRRQIELERGMRKLGYWYIRKRQTKGEVRRTAGSVRYFFVRKDEVAQAGAACDLDSSIVREGKERLFEERLYGQVFPSSDPYYYLPRYWLSRYVAYAAKGFPERAYAKWLVLHYLWARMRPVLGARSHLALFTRLCERDDYPALYLLRAVNAAFLAALAFYRSRRGTGAKAMDISTFFQRRNRDAEFESYWRGSSNPHRGSFKKAWVRFLKEFAAYDVNGS